MEAQQMLNRADFFSSPVYTIDKPEFLEVSRKVATKYIEKRKEEVELSTIYPVYMTEGINNDPEMLDFANYVAQIGWNILASQGYAMRNYTTFFEAMWCQEHHENSSMDKHIHGNGVQITGFYFLDCPDNSCRVLFHDPRDAKTIISLPEEIPANATDGSNIINFEPKEGMLMFSNSWVPHSFTKNASKKPMRFIHFNIIAVPTSFVPSNNTCAEVI